MNYKRFLFLLLSVSLLSFTTGCSLFRWLGGDISDDEVTELDDSMSDSQAQITKYNSSLRQFGRMLEAYDIAPTRVQSKIITNETADRALPSDVSRMLVTAVNKIGSRIIYVPYDPNYIINESTTGGSINRTLPQVVLTGGITEYDKDLIEKSRELKADAQVDKGQWGSNYSYDGGAGYSAEESVSRIAFDISMLDYYTQTSFPSSQVSNAILVRKSKLGWGIGAFFEGCGLTFDYNIKKQQGIYYAIRLLVELSTVETLGRYFDIPYWRCIPGASQDQELVSKLREEFNYLDRTQQALFIREYLFFHGYDVERTAPISQSDYNAINSAMQKYGKSSNTELFLYLWENVPIEEARKRNLDYKNRPAPPQLSSMPEPPPQNQAVQQPPAEEMYQPAAQREPPPQPEIAQQTPAVTAQAAPPQTQSAPQQQTQSSSKQTGAASKEKPVGFGDTDW